MNKLSQLNTRLHSLVIFRRLLSDAVVSGFTSFFDSLERSECCRVSAYAELASALFKSTTHLSEYILNLVLEDENFYMLQKAQGTSVPDSLEQALKAELEILQSLSVLSSKDCRESVGYTGFLPEWEISALDFYAVYTDRLKNISSCGYGIFAKYHTFMIQNSVLIPVKNPDPTRLSQLSGYQLERKKIIDNTLALLNGKPAANALLYGDAGTGKSSTVKAIANEYKNRGLRLIEVTKNQLWEIPALMDSLSKNPLKFILFIDDLSFTRDDDSFSALKAILEGSVSAKTSNLAIYATSNRRHLVKESFSDREGDDIHQNDTIEEMVSLSARFGLAVTFSKPDKKLYTDIVLELAAHYGLHTDPAALIAQAETYALRRGGRSPRIAKQFIEYLKTLE